MWASPLNANGQRRVSVPIWSSEGHALNPIRSSFIPRIIGLFYAEMVPAQSGGSRVICACVCAVGCGIPELMFPSYRPGAQQPDLHIHHCPYRKSRSGSHSLPPLSPIRPISQNTPTKQIFLSRSSSTGALPHFTHHHAFLPTSRRPTTSPQV